MPPGVTQVRRPDGTIIPAQQGAGGRKNEEESGNRWNPDNPWDTAHGVDPVVAPAPDQRRIDPGPAIGLDR
jgi:hypothetical protein